MFVKRCVLILDPVYLCKNSLDFPLDRNCHFDTEKTISCFNRQSMLELSQIRTLFILSRWKPEGQSPTCLHVGECKGVVLNSLLTYYIPSFRSSEAWNRKEPRACSWVSILARTTWAKPYCSYTIISLVFYYYLDCVNPESKKLYLYNLDSTMPICLYLLITPFVLWLLFELTTAMQNQPTC